MASEFDTSLEQAEELLETLEGTEPTNARQIERLQNAYCETCADTQGTIDVARDVLCAHRRCGLRDAEKLRQERAWYIGAYQELLPVAKATTKQIDAFNRYVADAGCVTPALVTFPSGRRGSGFRPATLRATLHLTLLNALAASAGDRVHLHAAETSADDAHEAYRLARQAQKRHDQRLALQLLTEGRSTAEIGRLLHRDPGTIQTWLTRALIEADRVAE